VLYAIEPNGPREEIVLAESISRFNQLIASRRERLQSIGQSLPASLWVVILAGTILNMVLTWLLVIGNRWLDIAINSLVAMLLGSFLYFIVAMDHPFRGRLSVSSEPYQQVYNSLMQGAQKAQ
jgi:predicted neutral ceramidase superfamily lipid hydrolase